ncbi:MAG: type transport system permease protein [Candidatus Sumerlaeota bacterium]|nr:type transport system permease protein [Candidatus Sumerlaeota bacterium]
MHAPEPNRQHTKKNEPFMRLLTGIYHNLLDNPILTRELRRRMRGKALVYSIIGYIILMAVTSALILLASYNPLAMAREQDTQKMLEGLAVTGFTLFKWISAIQGLLVLIIAPTITAGMTTGEKEKKTFDFLRVTTITPWMYILGCFLSTTFYVSLALICALPLISLAFLYGGISRTNVLASGGVLLGTSMVLSSFGLLISSLRERTRTAQGIVVFMIFSMLFGGGILYQQTSVWLGTTSAMAAAQGGNTATQAASSLLIFGFTVPSWVIGAAGMLFLTGVFLLIATRKLFDPDETRALSHWQFAVIAVGIVGTMLGVTKGQVVTNFMGLVFVSLGSLLLGVAALCFAVGRMEVGDEIWHLKRLLPFLRPFDQTLPFLVLTGFAWYFGVTVLISWSAGLSSMTAELFQAAALVGIAGYAFFCVFARFATAITVGRKGAGRITLAVLIAFWFVIPILGAIMATASPFAFVGHGLMRLSPFFMMIEGINDPKLYGSTNSFLALPGIGAVAFYTVLGVVFLVIGEYRRFRRWRGFDYHYDMPAR